MSYARLPSLYQQMIHLSRYARWMDSQGRRETWEETVDRYVGYMCDLQCKGKIPKEVREEIQEAILGLEVMPSMRCMMTAGKALEETHVAGYNCSAAAIDDIAVFSEALYLLMSGSGFGYSVERQFIASLPAVPEKVRPSRTVIKVEDSRIGWADAYRELLGLLYQGRIAEWDVSAVRPAGARLKTFGGRASGPGPLVDLFKFTIEIFKQAEGRKLTSIECHDVMCKVGEVVVAGGVRRSSLIALSNPSDDRMRHAKSGNWFDLTPWRMMANISTCYTEKPGMDVFMREWLALYESKSGERGFFNREAVKKHIAKLGRRDPDHEFLVNPCAEVLARNAGLCNLSEAVVRPGDTQKDLMRKVRIAAILGTMQATLTNFKYLRPIWKKNAEEEALLGVSLTGVMDNELMSGRRGKKELGELLVVLRDYVVKVNKEWAAKLGINPAAACTCSKPSGTVSCLVDSASGVHARYSKYYIRRVRMDTKDPMCQMMIDAGFPHEEDVYKPDNQKPFMFPMKSPEGAVVADETTAIDQLELWKVYQNHWAEHSVSCTVYVREAEWMEVGAWVYRHFDIIRGISFLPLSGHNYKQAPFESISQEEYDKLLVKMPKNVDWSKLGEYEKEDTTTNTKELACSAGKCDLT